MPDRHTLEETERAVEDHVAHLTLDVAAMHACASIFRAGNAIRDNVVRDVLRPHDLTWTGFLTLWSVWIWDERESHEVADSVGISKATLTGVVRTLVARGWLERSVPPHDKRRVMLSLTRAGKDLMDEIFPLFNAHETQAVSGLTRRETAQLTKLLRKVVLSSDLES